MPHGTPPTVAPSPASIDNSEELVKSARPHPWELALHPFKGMRFIGKLATDRRINVFVKVAYVGILALLLVAMLAPEGLLALIISAALPFVGPAINLPADAVVDWAVLGLAAYGLLGLFPRAIVSEYHARLFHPKRVAQRRR